MIGPGFIGALDGNMLSIYTANTIWKLPDIFETFCGLFPNFRCRFGQIDIFHSSANSLASFCYNLTNCFKSNSKAVPNCGKTISSGKKSVKKYTLLTFEQLKRLEERSNKPHSEQNTDIMWLVTIFCRALQF